MEMPASRILDYEDGKQFNSMVWTHLWLTIDLGRDKHQKKKNSSHKNSTNSQVSINYTWTWSWNNLPILSLELDQINLILFTEVV